MTKTGTDCLTDVDPASEFLRTSSTCKTLPELTTKQVLLTARSLLLSRNPKPESALYRAPYVAEGLFDGAEPQEHLSVLVSRLHPKEEAKLPNSPGLQRNLIEQAIREVLEAVRVFEKSGLSCALDSDFSTPTAMN